MSVVVKIVDVKFAWGTTRVEIVPACGHGGTTVLLDRVQALPEDYLNEVLHSQVESNFAGA